MKNMFFSCLMIFSFGCLSQNKQLLEAKAFSEKLKSTPDAVVLDVRTAGEYKEGFIDKAMNVDFNGVEFEDLVNKLDHGKTYFVYCLGGGRSASAASFMRKNGFKQVYELKGGMNSWRNNNLPVAMSKPANSDKISPEDYDALTKKSNIVLIDFYAPWCGPCRQMQPLLEELEKEYTGKASIIRINVDENKQLQRRMGIDEIPFFKRYINGVEKGNYIGQLDKKSLKRVLDGE
jgi:thioredoxin